ncbi:MAG: hypothetical protein M1816_003560 [Peltula sp. TS41687]|nr:MAG: hypothetical protein M1816_003560 [Peltula sp. TS41687]
MTGLDPATDSILQISCLVTDHALNLLDKVGWGAIIHHPTSVLESMNEWCIGTHRSTGLTEAVLKSSTTADQAATELLGYIKRFVPQPRTAMLAGNSIHTDRAFLTKKPYDTVLEHLHYRIFDVSSIKEAARRWASPKVLQRAPKKKLAHEARQDVLESIEEARFYRKAFFA